MVYDFTKKVWLTSVLLTPFLIAIYILIFVDFSNYNRFPIVIPAMIIIGFIASMPNFFLLYLFTKKMYQLNYPSRDIKILTNVFSLLLTWLLFSIVNWLLDGNYQKEPIILFYSFTLTLGIWFFPLPMEYVENEVSENELKIK